MTEPDQRCEHRKAIDIQSEQREEHDGQSIPDDPERAVDAIDERVFGESPDPAEDEVRENPTPAFEQDLDPEDQGSADAVALQAE